jgi:hypothetical protein
MNWKWSTVADRFAQVLRKADAQVRLEQAVYGLDARDENSLQELLSDGLGRWYEVVREAHYPSSVGRKLTHRQRCDLVLTPRGQPLRVDSAPPTLFDPPNAVGPGEALWLEVKVAYQFREGGVIHGGYGSQWRSAIISDLKKMESEPAIRRAGLVLIVFNESAEILQKDLGILETSLAEKEVLAQTGMVRSVPIQDRIGHRLCTAAFWPTVQR